MYNVFTSEEETDIATVGIRQGNVGRYFQSLLKNAFKHGLTLAHRMQGHFPVIPLYAPGITTGYSQPKNGEEQ